jgi:hypothetical protein
MRGPVFSFRSSSFAIKEYTGVYYQCCVRSKHCSLIYKCIVSYLYSNKYWQTNKTFMYHGSTWINSERSRNVVMFPAKEHQACTYKRVGLHFWNWYTDKRKQGGICRNKTCIVLISYDQIRNFDKFWLYKLARQKNPH